MRITERQRQIESLEILTTAVNLAHQQQQIIDCANNIITDCRRRKWVA